MEIHALQAQGWSISAISRHGGLDRKTVRAYLSGEREPGKHNASGLRSSNLDAFVLYLNERFRSDPQIWSTVLYDEITNADYRHSYSSFTRELRKQNWGIKLSGSGEFL